MADSSTPVAASGTDTALSRQAEGRGVDVYTGIEKRVFDLPTATVEAVLRRQVEAHGGLKMSSARDVLSGGRIIHLSATGWKGQYRNAEIRLVQTEGSTAFSARADVREPTRISSMKEALSSIVTVGGLSYLIYTLPAPLVAGTGRSLGRGDRAIPWSRGPGAPLIGGTRRLAPDKRPSMRDESGPGSDPRGGVRMKTKPSRAPLLRALLAFARPRSA